MQDAADELHNAAIALRELIEREYPSRRETDAKFSSKRKANQRWYLALILILASTLLSFVTTVSTVSSCFLGRDDKHPQVCQLMPGYEDTVKRNRACLKDYLRLQELIIKNHRRLNRLEKR